MKNTKGLAKIAVALIAAGASLAQAYFDRKELDEKVAEKVAEALSNQAKES